MADPLPCEELLACQALRKLIQRSNGRYRFREFRLAGLGVSVHQDSAKSRAIRSVHIVTQGIANEEYLLGGRHSRNLQEFEKKVPRWLPEAALGGNHERLEIVLPMVVNEHAPGPLADVIRRQYQSVSSACLFEKGLSIIKGWTALDPYVGKSL
jgi:hypothetical protein